MSEAAELRELCNRFFDAIENRDMGVIADCLHPGLQFWVNFTGQTKGRADMLEAIEKGYAVHRRRLYNDRRIRPFGGGFLMQYTCEITRHDGSKSALWAAVVARVRDGKIARVDEYMDAGKFAAPPARGEAEDASAAVGGEADA